MTLRIWSRDMRFFITALVTYKSKMEGKTLNLIHKALNQGPSYSRDLMFHMSLTEP